MCAVVLFWNTSIFNFSALVEFAFCLLQAVRIRWNRYTKTNPIHWNAYKTIIFTFWITSCFYYCCGLCPINRGNWQFHLMRFPTKTKSKQTKNKPPKTKPKNTLMHCAFTVVCIEFQIYCWEERTSTWLWINESLVLRFNCTQLMIGRIFQTCFWFYTFQILYFLHYLFFFARHHRTYSC